MQPTISCDLADVEDAEFRIEVDRLVAMNYAETGPQKIGLNLKMDWGSMERAQGLGAMYVVGCWRSDPRPQHLVGYAVVWLARHPTYCGQTVAQCSSLFVESDARGSGAGLSLIRKMTDEARERGADVFLMGCPLSGQSETLFRALGWSPVETLFAKVLA